MDTHCIRLMGGLGNQMFQYAFARRLAINLKQKVEFDLENGFRNDPACRMFALGSFNVEIVRAKKQSIPWGMTWRSPWHRLAKATRQVVPERWQNVKYEKAQFQYDANIFNGTIKPTYYSGYWQHENYFSPLEAKIKREFTLRDPVQEQFTALMNEMKVSRSISIHVRRYHDKDKNGTVIAAASARHGVCPAEYFQQALSLIGCTGDTVGYIFSDDVSWVKANLKLPIPCRYVTDICTCSDAEELLLMAACSHHIISNSSFSWWGAWLGGNQSKIIVAPRRWIGGPSEEDVNICPSSWIRI